MRHAVHCHDTGNGWRGRVGSVGRREGRSVGTSEPSALRASISAMTCSALEPPQHQHLDMHQSTHKGWPYLLWLGWMGGAVAAIGGGDVLQAAALVGQRALGVAGQVLGKRAPPATSARPRLGRRAGGASGEGAARGRRGKRALGRCGGHDGQAQCGVEEERGPHWGAPYVSRRESTFQSEGIFAISLAEGVIRG